MTTASERIRAARADLEVTPRTVADKVAELIEKAPAGGIFHDAVLNPQRVLHDGFANEQRYFIVDVAGRKFCITVEQV